MDSYLPRMREHEMFGDDDLESEGDDETDLAVFQDADIRQLYCVGQDNIAKHVSEALASFVTDAARKKSDSKFLEAAVQKYNRPLNCDGLIIPKTNVLIWIQLKKPQRFNPLAYGRILSPTTIIVAATLKPLKVWLPNFMTFCFYLFATTRENFSKIE